MLVRMCHRTATSNLFQESNSVYSVVVFSSHIATCLVSSLSRTLFSTIQKEENLLCVCVCAGFQEGVAWQLESFQGQRAGQER